MAEHTVGVLLEGGPSKADLLLVDVGEGPMVVKDFANKSGWIRFLGRVQIGRESRAYRWLGRLEGLPAFIGRVDSHALAIEWIRGQRLAFASGLPRDQAALIDDLKRLVARLHQRGLVHLDLRGRENVLVREDGSLVVVDLAGAVWFRPGGWLHRLLFPTFSLADRAALIKWKEILTPGSLTSEERTFQRRFRRLRSLWVLNRKQR